MAITDIFSRRYADKRFVEVWSKTENAFMVQAMTMMKTLLWKGGNLDTVDAETDKTYRVIHDKVALELGLEHLSYPFYQMGTTTQRFQYPYLIRAFLIASPGPADDAAVFFNDRMSLIEQAFKHRYEQVQSSNAVLADELAKASSKDRTRGSPLVSKAPPPIGSRPRSSTYSEAKEALEGLVRKQESSFFADCIRSANETMNKQWDEAVEELNERLRISGFPLHFHNGLLQMRGDELLEEEVHEWFWDLVSDPMWKSVDEQMKEAFDRRDSGDRTAPFHAVSALESVIKIISGQRNANTGNEKGAANYIDNLISERSGRFIESWEGDMLKSMFRDVRNPFGHGPGDNDLPKMTMEQTDWAIDTAMSWSNSLIRRL